MTEIKDREKIVRDLVNTFNDRDELHRAYKNKMKEIILKAFIVISEDFERVNVDSIDIPFLKKWVDKFVEENFKPKD